MNTKDIIKELKEYDGSVLRIMEVCGTHTASISENAIPSLISDKIELISGPGCPVCVSVASYIDKLCELALKDSTCVVTFGDMIRVPGSSLSLKDAMARGGNVKMVYSPFETVEFAKKNPDTQFVFAAVGFETTTPIYALLIDELIKEDIKNVKLLTALKTMPAVIDKLCHDGSDIDGFLAPGHVSVITGSDIFKSIAEKYSKPFVVSGFCAEEILSSIYALVKLRNQGVVKNLYKRAVTAKGNEKAQYTVNKYFTPCTASWRGLGEVENSGMILRKEYSFFDAGSASLTADSVHNGCRCPDVITGKLKPHDCPIFGKFCTPSSPKGACMVSNEGSCFHYYNNGR